MTHKTSVSSDAADPFEIVIDAGDRKHPIYRQVAEVLSAAISDGTLPPGTKLPPVRELSERLGINSMTVAKAYRYLGDQGLASGQGPRGTFVTQPGSEVLGAAAGKLKTGSRKAKTTDDGPINFTGGYPASDSVDFDHFTNAMSFVLRSRKHEVHGYEVDEIAEQLSSSLLGTVLKGCVQPSTSPHDCVITTGGQQGLGLVINLLVRHGSVVLTQQPTYMAALEMFRGRGAEVVGIGSDAEISPADIRRVARNRQVSLLYLVPTFNSPTGSVIEGERRKAILEECRKLGIAILEDDPCPEISYSGKHTPIIACADPGDPVYYVRGFGKSYVPGMRLGIVVGPKGSGPDLTKMKRLLDLHTCGILMAAFHKYINGPGAAANLDQIRARSERRMRSLIAALEHHIGDAARWTVPKGGFNLWLQLPEGIDDEVFATRCLNHGLSVVAGLAFFPGDPAYPALRISIGSANEAQIDVGVRRLAAVFREVKLGSRAAMRIVV